MEDTALDVDNFLAFNGVSERRFNRFDGLGSIIITYPI